MKKTFTDFLRLGFKWFLDPVAGFLNRIGLTPNSVTLIGVAGNIVAAFFIARGQITIGGLIVLIVWPIDALDGSMARLRGEASDWGAFVDSVSDRYSELIILGAVLYYFAMNSQHHLGGCYFCCGGRFDFGFIRQGACRSAKFQRQRRLADARGTVFRLGPIVVIQYSGHWCMDHRHTCQLHSASAHLGRARSGS